MVIFGMMALTQLTFLPGVIVLQTLKFKGFLRGIIIAFGLSLLINFQIAFLLTCLGLYRRNILLSIFIAELFLLIYLNRRLIALPVGVPFKHLWNSVLRFKDAYVDLGGEQAGSLSRKLILGSKIIAFFSALGFLLWYLWTYGQQYNNVFTVWDAIVSWDRWALDWSQNKLPGLTWHYPQLIPSAWSITYLFVDDPDVKQFARWLMGVFEIFIPLTFFIMGWLKRSSAYFWGCTASAWLILQLGSRAYGNVDTAVACLSLIAVSCIWLARDETDARQYFLLILFGALIAGASALIKQAGLWTILVFPILYLINRSKNWTRRISKFQWLLLIGVVLLAVAPWNIYKQVQIGLHLDQSELPNITSGAHHNRDLLDRPVFAYNKLKKHLGYGDIQLNNYFTSIAVLMAVSLFVPRIRWILLLINIPNILLWVFILSYDERNLTYPLPFIGLSIGFGWDWLINKTFHINNDLRALVGGHKLAGRGINLRAPDPVAKLAERIFSIRILYAALALVLIIALLPLRYSNSYLKQSAINKQKENGSIPLNKLLYDYYDENGFQGKILSDYQILFGLPDIRNYYVLGYSNQLSYIQQLSLPEISYALYCVDWASPELSALMKTKMENGEFRFIFKDNCWQLVSLCKDGCK